MTQKTRTFALSLASGGLTILLAEILLRFLAPVSLTTIGRVSAPNAVRYGWGYAPGEEVLLRDPDSGETFDVRMNTEGWRGPVHTRAKAPGIFRILVLGDSNTFGPVVPDEALYTVILEKALRSQGWAVEVIAMGLGGWSTDQELEALRSEGMRYSPDLVCIQFCTNDLEENLSLEKPKPFRYVLLDDGSVKREERSVSTGNRARTYGIAHTGVGDLQLAKRGLIAWRRLRAAGPWVRNGRRLRASPRQVEQIQMAFSLEPSDPLLRDLQAQGDGPLDPAEVGRQIQAAGHAALTQEITRLLEDWWFHDLWRPEMFRPAAIDNDSEPWRIFFALLARAQDTATRGGADLAVISDNEEGHYEWERYWHRIAPDSRSHVNYLSPTAALRRFCGSRGIGFVDLVVPHTRARNDPHPNAIGNAAMAENLRLFVLSRYRARLPRLSPGVDD